MRILAIACLSVLFFGCAQGGKKADDGMAKKEPAKKEMVADKGAKTMASGDSVNCTVGGDSRTIEVREDGKGCQVIYTKHGESNSIASGTYGLDHCKKVQDQIKGNLSSAGFTCK